MAPPHPVFGSTFLREASRKGAFLTSDRLTPCIHQSGASCPAPSLHTSRGETGGKNPTGFVGAFLSLAFFMPAFSDPFQRGKGCSVVRGGWRSQAGVVTKMFKWWWCCWRCGVLGGGCCLRGGLLQWWFKITIDKEKPYLKESQPDESRRIPSKQQPLNYLTQT